MAELTSDEKEQRFILQNGVSPITKISINPLSFDEKAIKKSHIAMTSAQEAFIDSRFILPTSNIIERIISKPR